MECSRSCAAERTLGLPGGRGCARAGEGPGRHPALPGGEHRPPCGVPGRGYGAGQPSGSPRGGRLRNEVFQRPLPSVCAVKLDLAQSHLNAAKRPPSKPGLRISFPRARLGGPGRASQEGSDVPLCRGPREVGTSQETSRRTRTNSRFPTEPVGGPDRRRWTFLPVAGFGSDFSCFRD